MAKLSCFLFFIILWATSLNPITCFKHRELPEKMLFVFGDSLFDGGNNRFINTSISNPQDNYPYGINYHNTSTGRVSDGLVVPDFIAKFQGLDLPTAFLLPNARVTGGVNFASAGSGCLNIHDDVVNLDQQIKNFRSVVTKSLCDSNKVQELISKSVVLISMGGNDYFSFASNQSNNNATDKQKDDYVDTVIAQLRKGIKDLYILGARNFAIQDVAPLGCLPLAKDLIPDPNGHECNQILKYLACDHNKKVKSTLKQMASEKTDFRHGVFDYYYQMLDRIYHPTKYGFLNGTSGCCGAGPFNGKDCGVTTANYTMCDNIYDYVFWDGGHTTQKNNQQIARLMWNGTEDVITPYNVSRLFQSS